MSQNADTNNNPQTTSGMPEFGIQRIYLKDLSFEAPLAPQIFLQKWEPAVDLQLNTKATKLEDAIHEVVLEATVTVTTEQKTAFLVEVKQAGIFFLKDFPASELDAVLGSVCPSILFPYLREVVSDVVTRGSFPQLILAPVNFDALYAQQKATEGEGQQTIN